MIGPYADTFGFTEQEVSSILTAFQVEDHADIIRDWYNGYSFGGHTIYNPWSLISYIQAIPNPPSPKWLNTSSNALVYEELGSGGLEIKRDLEVLLSGEELRYPLSENITFGDIGKNPVNIWSLLYYSGYLKADDPKFAEYDPNLLTYSLSIPNQENFVAKSTIKSAERILATPFASKAALNTIIGSILADNPWGCTPYLSGGENLPGVQKSAEKYTGTVIYENNDGKQVGRISIRAPSSGAFDTTIANILANEALETAIGGVASHDRSEDGFSVTLKCHAASGELYNVSFKREKVIVSSFEADSILTTIETWADTVPALA